MYLVLLIIIFINVVNSAQTGNFINGSDISFLQQVENNGGNYYKDGLLSDPLDIFQQNEVNYIRLRIWHTPAAGYNNLEKTLLMAARIKAAGFKFLLDFHYSDTWADPGWQEKPAAWDTLSFEELNDSLYSYTFNVIHTFDSLNLLPDMVQIGNEITNGFLQPDGLIGDDYRGFYNTPAQWAKFTTLLTTASNAVNDAVDDTTIPIMIHIDNGIGNIGCRRFIDSLNANQIPFDVIGLTYYPWWQGTLTSLTQNVNDLAVSYDKDIIVVETAYPWTLDSLSDNTGNFVTNQGQLHSGYPASLFGQYSFLYDLIQVIKNIPNGKGKGLFYWEPEWISTPTFGSEYENLTFFDFQGNVLGPIGVFREPDIPLIDTLYVNFLSNSPVVLNAKVNTGNQNTTVRFQWDTDNDGVWLNDQTSDISPIVMDGLSNLTITGLAPNTLFYYRAYVSNASGSDTSLVKSFTTPHVIPVDSLIAYPLTSNDDGYLVSSTTNTNTFRTSVNSIMGDISGGYRHSLIRFSGVGSVAGKIIDSAFVYFTAYENLNNSTTGVKIRIAANDTVNAQPVSSSRPIELGKVLTTAKVDWNNIHNWNDGIIYRSPNIKTIIQEWADLSNHQLSDAILLFFNNNSSSTNGRRIFSQWDYKPGSVQGQEKPKLVVYYHTNEGSSAPTIDSVYVDSLRQTTAKLNAEINTGNQSTTIRFQWDINSDAVWANDQLASNSPLTTDGLAVRNITGLNPNTTYYFRAYVSNASGSDTSFVKSFTTLPAAPTIDSVYVDSLTQTTVKLNAEINTGNQSTTIRFQWDLDNNAVWANEQLANNSPLTLNGLAARSVTGLSPNTTYYFRAYVSNASGSDTSIVKSFITAAPVSSNDSLIAYPLTSTDDGYLVNSNTNTNRTSLFSIMGNISGGYRHALIRFPGVGAAAGKTIDSAFVYLTAYGNSSYTGTNIRISANDTVNAQPISANRNIELGKALTTAMVDWNNIPNWNDGIIYRSPNIKTIIQEWADISNHQMTDALLLFFNNNSSGTNGRRVFSQWDYKPGSIQGQEKPKLVIYYHTGLSKLSNNEAEILPEKYELFQNYPNPFNPSTNIKFSIPEADRVRLDVFNILGEHIITLIDRDMEAGFYNIPFSAGGFASGIYIYRLYTPSFLQIKKMILIK